MNIEVIMTNCSSCIPIVFAINNDYVKQLTVTVISILKNSSIENNFIFYIISADISDENKNIIKSLNYLNNNIEFIFICGKSILEKVDLENYMRRMENYNYISIETYFRFFIADLIPQHNKILYLDADLIVMDDLQKLYNFNIDNYIMGVVQDMNMEVLMKTDYKISSGLNFRQYFMNILKKQNLKYFNAGVLLLNLKKWRENNVLNELLKFCEENNPLEYQDQDALNAVLENNVIYLDSRYNLFKDFDFYISHQNDKNRIKELKKCFKNPGIIHYIGENKPWVYKEKFWYSYEKIKEWWRYYRISPLYDRKNELILKAIDYNRFARLYFEYINISLFNFKIIRIYKDDKRLRFEILFIKITLKLKKYEKVELSI